jgi:hypothetical protein
MKISSRSLAGALTAGAGVAAAGYAGLVAWHRYHYGNVAMMAGPHSLLDRFIPSPEVLEQHQIMVDAPAEIVMDAARDTRMLASPLVRAIIRAREIALGGEPDGRTHPEALFDQMQSIGWVVLAESPGRELVMGAATIPWHANPIFRSIAAAEFEAFREPGYVKIAWSLRAEPVGTERSIFRTETRVSTTDCQAREQFRRYWSYVAPGVELIRIAMLRPVKHEAERRYQFEAV